MYMNFFNIVPGMALILLGKGASRETFQKIKNNKTQTASS